MGQRGCKRSPIVFSGPEDEGPSPHLIVSDERLGGKSGGPFLFHLLSESIGGIIFDAMVERLEVANHGVEAYGHVEREFVGRISKDESRRAACIIAKGDGVKDGEDGIAKVDHIVICRRDNYGGLALLSCV